MKPQFKLEEIYLDLSKLSEEEINRLRLEDSDFLEFSDIELFRLQNPEYMILSFNHGKFNISHKDWFSLNYKTELTYSQFLDMMGESEEVLQVENNGWIEVNDTLPLCVSTGDWDGKQSEIILAETITGKKFLAQCYEGFMDGSAFYDWYQVDEINSNDWLINESVSRWMKIPF